MTAAAASTRQQRHRARQREGVWLVRVEVSADLVDALETAGYGPAGGIETREDAATAVAAALEGWQIAMDRLDPSPMTPRRADEGEPK